MSPRGLVVLVALGVGLVLVDPSRGRADAPSAGVAPAGTPASTASALAPTSAAAPVPTSGSAPAPGPPTALAPVEDAVALDTLPLGRGLPVIVRAGVAFVEIDGVDEQEGTFTATIDVRLRWDDPRLRFAADPLLVPFHEYRGEAAVEQLARIWTPDVRLANRVGEPTHEARGLRITPDGEVELMERMTATFATSFDVQRFPFDRQDLPVEIVSEREDDDRLAIEYGREDIEFSRVADGVSIAGWDTGLVDMHRDPLAGWHGDSHSRLRVALEVQRHAADSIPSLFVPLFASLLIPLLATWLNKVEDGEFGVEAFELTNIVIGGLFAVIALNFTVNADHASLGLGDNTIARLFGLNYLTLAISLLINVALFRFNVVRRCFGKYVQEQVYRYLTWALPLLSGATAIAFVLVAMAA